MQYDPKNFANGSNENGNGRPPGADEARDAAASVWLRVQSDSLFLAPENGPAGPEGSNRVQKDECIYTFDNPVPLTKPFTSHH